MSESAATPLNIPRQQPQAVQQPPLPTFTDRELRRIAEQIEILTKARRASEGLGVTGLVDVISVEFPIGIRAVLRWTPRAANDTETRLHYLGRARDAYQLDLITPVTEPVIKLREPQKTRDGRNDPQARRIGDRVKREAAGQVLDIVISPEAQAAVAGYVAQHAAADPRS